MNEPEFIKAFICDSRQNYYEAVHKYEPDIADRVMFGNFDAGGEGCEYELSIKWIVLSQYEARVAPRLEVFHDAFKALTEHSELFRKLASLHRKDFTPDDFSRLLLGLGYKDLSDKPLA